MRLKLLLITLGLVAITALGLQAFGPLTKADSREAIVDIKPETLDLNMQGTWITAYIKLEGYDVSDIDTSSILLEGLFAPEWSKIEGDFLMVKFDASSVINYLWNVLYHMGGNRVRVELTIAGQLRSGTQFAGMDTITIMDPVEY